MSMSIDGTALVVYNKKWMERRFEHAMDLDTHCLVLACWDMLAGGTQPS